MKARHFIVFFFIFLWAIARADAHAQFESAEHEILGNAVKIRFNQTEEPQTNHHFQLTNGLTVTYGELVLLSGDFYALEDTYIASGASLAEREALFLKAFETLNEDPHAVNETQQILAILHDQEELILNAKKDGIDPETIYAETEESTTIAWSCETGGMCLRDYPFMSPDIFRKIYFLNPGRYLRLLDKNFDHFGNEALLAYEAGHELALEKAQKAHETHDVNTLALAYELNAFASHYLSDIFSAGHMRTPRLALYHHMKFQTLGSLLSAFMHQEDGNLGLEITNANGDIWKAYGDKHLQNPKNQKNQEIVIEALQASADDIYETYLMGNKPASDKALAYTPNLSILLKDPKNTNNPAPLFYWDEANQILYRRVNLSDPKDYEWTSEWSGWKTYYDLIQLMDTQGASINYFVSQLNR